MRNLCRPSGKPAARHINSADQAGRAVSAGDVSHHIAR
jgi:hypothetical protein